MRVRGSRFSRPRATTENSEDARVSPAQQISASSAERLPPFFVDRREVAPADLADPDPSVPATRSSEATESLLIALTISLLVATREGYRPIPTTAAIPIGIASPDGVQSSGHPSADCPAIRLRSDEESVGCGFSARAAACGRLYLGWKCRASHGFSGARC